MYPLLKVTLKGTSKFAGLPNAWARQAIVDTDGGAVQGSLSCVRLPQTYSFLREVSNYLIFKVK